MIPGLDDAWLLFLVSALPIAGALFTLAMPGVDRLALRYVGMGTSVATGVLACRAAYVAILPSTPPSAVVDVVTITGLHLDVGPVHLALDGLAVPLLLSLVVATPIALRSGAPRVFERTQFYIVTILFAEGLLAAALVVDGVLLRLAVSAVASVPFFALVALFGGPQRGTTTMRAAMIWMLVDIAALAVVAWRAARAGIEPPRATVDDLARGAATLGADLQPWIFLVLAAPGLVRLAAGPFSVWLAAFLDEAPVSAVILGACGAAPLGAHLVLRMAVPTAPQGLVMLMPWICAVGALAVVLSGVIAIAERDLRRLLAQLLQASGVVAALSLLCLGDAGVLAGTAHVVAAGASATWALTAIEATERRFETRDAVDLAGLAQAVPLLATFLILGLFALTCVPGLGAGATLWLASSALATSPGLAAAGLPPLASAWLAVSMVTGALLASVGVVGAARRILQPAPRKARPILDELNAGQAARLFVPAGFALAAGLFASTLVEGAGVPARALASRARTAAGLSEAPPPPPGPAAVAPVDDVEPVEPVAPVEPAPDDIEVGAP
jgi:NADH-quinone oxidoreductase subunit M